ncbi:MAG: hypothetical protein AAF517_18750 [Planctomycetota bacterium]
MRHSRILHLGADSLTPTDDPVRDGGLLIAAALRFGEVRLIDNIWLSPAELSAS